MKKDNFLTLNKQPSNNIVSSDILNGLLCCERELLCIYLSLFEDNLLHRQIAKVYNSYSDKISKKIYITDKSNKINQDDIASSVLQGKNEWLKSSFDDETLRLILWVYLRDAFNLDESVSLSRRGIDTAGDDIVASIMSLVNKASKLHEVINYFKNDKLDVKNISFNELCDKTLSELVKSMLSNNDNEAEIVNEVKKQFNTLDSNVQNNLLKEIGADELNDKAIRTILYTSGSLTAFCAGVGMSGFSAYILAAQVSAFIPFVSGPGLVSLVSVLSNPVTTIAAIAGSAWWVASSANTTIKQNVSTLVTTLLCIQSFTSSKTNYQAISSMFTKINHLDEFRDLSNNSINHYKELWGNVKDAYKFDTPKMEHNLDDILSRPLDWNKKQQGRLEALLFPNKDDTHNIVNLALLSIGDVIYNLAAINPTVINALDFSRVDDISDALDFAGFAQSIMAMSPISVSGAVNNLKGYVAEQFVAMELISQGHQVSFPDTSNQAGWDLLVDGERFQVKCLGERNGLEEHFSKYDFPVIANSELSDNLSDDWADKVFFIDGFSNEFIVNLTDSSLSHGATSLSPDVPLFAFTMSAIENYKQFKKGAVNIEQAIHQVMLEGTAKIGLATFGGFTGNAIGLLAFGPAGALVFGTTLPIIVQAQSTRLIKGVNKYTDRYKIWSEKARDTSTAFVDAINESIDKKIDIVKSKLDALGYGLLSHYMRARFYQDILYLCEMRSKVKYLSDNMTDIEKSMFDLITLAGTSTIHPVHYQRELDEIINIIEERPKLRDTFIKKVRKLTNKE